MHPTQEIISEIKALSSHYPKRARSTADEERWLMDWATDLSGFDPRDIRLVCAQWRSGESNRMPTPGELVSKCRTLVKPELARRVEPPPEREFSREHKARMQAAVMDLIGELGSAAKRRGSLDRRPGETETQQAERLWPSHRVDRMRT
jgi:hypothetical protein